MVSLKPSSQTNLFDLNPEMNWAFKQDIFQGWFSLGKKEEYEEEYDEEINIKPILWSSKVKYCSLPTMASVSQTQQTYTFLKVTYDHTRGLTHTMNTTVTLKAISRLHNPQSMVYPIHKKDPSLAFCDGWGITCLGKSFDKWKGCWG